MVDKKCLAILIIVKFGGDDGVNQLDIYYRRKLRLRKI